MNPLLERIADRVSQETGLSVDSFGINEIVFKAKDSFGGRKSFFAWETHAGQQTCLRGLVSVSHPANKKLTERISVYIGFSLNIQDMLAETIPADMRATATC